VISVLVHPVRHPVEGVGVLRTVLAQTIRDLEVLIVGTEAKSKALQAALDREGIEDGRIRWVDASGGRDPFAFAASHATGEWVAYTGRGVLWFPDHLETLQALTLDAGAVALGDVLTVEPGQGILGVGRAVRARGGPEAAVRETLEREELVGVLHRSGWAASIDEARELLASGRSQVQVTTDFRPTVLDLVSAFPGDEAPRKRNRRIRQWQARIPPGVPRSWFYVRALEGAVREWVAAEGPEEAVSGS